jgi:hypothetical protein
MDLMYKGEELHFAVVRNGSGFEVVSDPLRSSYQSKVRKLNVVYSGYVNPYSPEVLQKFQSGISEAVVRFNENGSIDSKVLDELVGEHGQVRI